jgi:hypothetical protein
VQKLVDHVPESRHQFAHPNKELASDVSAAH